MTVIPAADGSVAGRFTTSRRDRTIRVALSGPALERNVAWSVQLSGIAQAVGVVGGAAIPDELGVPIKATQGTVTITV